jgi:hypothetical protein
MELLRTFMSKRQRIARAEWTEKQAQKIYDDWINGAYANAPTPEKIEEQKMQRQRDQQSYRKKYERKPRPKRKRLKK